MISVTTFGAHFIFFALAGFHATVSEFVCPSPNGIFANYEECHSYYICSSAKPSLRLCSPGLLFNSITKICDWPAYVSCSTKDVEVSPEPEYRIGIPSPEITCSDQFRVKSATDCQAFYSCLDGVAYKERCSKGLFFNSKTQNCDFPQNADCVAVQAAQSGPVCRTPGATSPNKQNCSTYWEQCSGSRILRTCDQGHHYSEKLKQCIVPCVAKCDVNAVCDESTTVEMRSSIPVTTLPSTISTREATIRTTTTARIPIFKCQEADTISRNPNDCTSYWICTNKNPTLQHCSNGFHFSEQLKQCVEPCAAKCDPTVVCKSNPDTSQCKGNQFLRHENDCNKFYYCSKGLWLQKSCPVGLHFNVISSACDFPCNAKCDKAVDCFTDPDVCHHNGLFPHVSECQKFYICHNGVTFIKNCPVGLHFDKVLKVCNWPCEAKCDQRMNCLSTENNSSNSFDDVCKGDRFYASDGNCSQFYNCHQKKAFLENCPSGLHWNKQKSLCDWPCNAKCDPSVKCEKADEDEVKHPFITTSDICKGREFYPHEKDCTHYYHCVHGIAYLMDCPDDLHWSLSLSRCEWPCEAKCDPSIVCSTVGLNITDNGNEKGICNGKSGEFMRWKDCTKFYHCDHGRAHLKDCPAGLHWSQERRRCDWPCEAKCDTKAVCGLITPVDPLYPPANRSDICKEKEFYPHENDCEKFYHCANRIAHMKTCPDNLHWSVERSRCEWNCNAKCDNTLKCSNTDQNWIEPTLPNITRNDKCQNKEFYPHESDCTKFYYCDHGIAYLKVCPSILHWSTESNRCEWPCLAKCDKNQSCENKFVPPDEPTLPAITKNGICQGKEFYPHESDCTRFYHCDFGIAYLKICPNNLHWSVERNRCEWPCVAKCQKQLNCDKNILNPVEPTLPIIIKKDVCGGKEFLRHENDCTKFYHCANSIAFLKVCPGDLHWSVKRNRCEYSCIAECVKQQNCDTGNTNVDPSEPTLPVITRRDICKGGEFYPYAQDCNKFYHCANDIAYLKVCPSNLDWSTQNNRCEWNCTAHCNTKLNCEVGAEEPEEPSLPVIIKDSICKDKEFYPHKSDCGKFYHCSQGRAHLKVCPSNLHWNIEKNECDRPCRAQCIKQNNCGNDFVDPVDPTLPVITKRDICKSKEFYPYETDCTKFYHCAHKIAYLKVCPSNLHWSIQRNRCETPCLAQCDVRSKCEERSGETTDPTLPVMKNHDVCKGAEFYSHETDCSKFYHCDHGIGYMKVCPSVLHWSVERNRCEWPCLAQCIKQQKCEVKFVDPVEPTLPVITRKDICKDKDFYPHETDCTKFYHCAHTIAYMKLCPSNLHWSIESNRCELPCNAQCDKTVRKCENTNVDPIDPTLPVITKMDLCKGEDFYPYPEDCNKFYHCDNGIAFLKVCPSNLHWSTQWNRCEWHCTAGCQKKLNCDIDAEVPEEPTLPVIKRSDICNGSEFYPHKTDCMKFYHCAHGIAYLKMCPSNLHWNVKRNLCDWPCSAQCVKQKECEKYYVDPVDPTLPVITKIDICKGKEFYSYEMDCAKFYHCANGLAYMKVCPSYLHWSIQRNRCEQPCHAKCDLRLKCDGPTEEPVEPTLPVIKKNAICKGAEFYSHESDCSKFYHCALGIGYMKVCPSVLHWSVERNRCEWPCIAQCVKQKKCEGNSTDYEEPTLPVVTRTDVCQGKEFYPHESDCTKFYHCANKIAYQKLCPSNLHWNIERSRCEWPCIAQCDKTKQKCDNRLIHPVEPTLPIITRRDICEDKEFYSHPTDCTKFYHCAHRLGYLKVCPANLHWNQQKNLCESPCLAKCNTTVQCGKDQTPETALPTIKENSICKGSTRRFYPHKTDCNKFYQCAHEVGILRVCQANLHWSAELNQCEWPCTAKCDPNLKCSAEYYENDLTVRPVPKTQFQCPRTSGLFTDPDNCKRFYHCSHGIAHHKWCPSNLHFNAGLMVCDWPDRAGCAQIQPNMDNSTINFGNDEGTCSCECCLIPDEKDCQTFYLCLNTRLYRRKCSPGLLYNAEIQTCDHPEHLKKKCDNVSSKEDVAKVISPICQWSGELLNHETDCNSFYHCDHGIPKLRTCPPGLHLSATMQRCEYPCVAKCEERKECAEEQKHSSETNDASTRAVFTCPSYRGLFPDANDCNKFFHCDHYIAHHKVCPSNLHFNPSLMVCDWPYRAGCINGKISRDTTDAIGNCSCECCLQADQHQCNKFTLCLHGKLYPGSCGDGLFFNPKEETCDLEEKVRHLCAKEQPAIKNVCQCADCRLPHPTDCALYHQCSGGTANEEKCPAGQSFNRQTFECDQSEKVECPVIRKTELCSSPGMFKSPNSCNEFIVCTHGKAYIEKCPAKLEFNTDIKVCDYPKGKCK